MEHDRHVREAHQRPKRRGRLIWIAGLALCGLALAGIAAGPVMSRVEQPEYKVESSDGPIEVRSYGPMIAAEASVKGERRAAIREGFRLIAAYIFGNNAPREKIAMTAPVQQQKQTIAMTAPVTGQFEDGVWVVRFIMPKSWTMESLPVPSDPRVRLEAIPAHRFLAITFPGFAGDSAIRERTEELKRYALGHNLQVTVEPVLAFYNPPWTLPFFRRNEVMFQLAPQSGGEQRT
jgi:hypothetical protein